MHDAPHVLRGAGDVLLVTVLMVHRPNLMDCFRVWMQGCTRARRGKWVPVLCAQHGDVSPCGAPAGISWRGLHFDATPN